MPMAECTQLLIHWGHNRPQHMATATSFHQSSPAASRECLQPSFHKENQIEEQIRPSPDLGLRAKIVSVDHHVTPWWCWQVRRKHSISSISNMIKWYQIKWYQMNSNDWCFGLFWTSSQQKSPTSIPSGDILVLVSTGINPFLHDIHQEIPADQRSHCELRLHIPHGHSWAWT